MDLTVEATDLAPLTRHCLAVAGEPGGGAILEMARLSSAGGSLALLAGRSGATAWGEVPVSCAEPGEILVNAKLLAAAAGRDTGQLRLRLVDGRLEVRGRGWRVRLPLGEVARYPFDTPQELAPQATLGSGLLGNLLRRALVLASSDDSVGTQNMVSGTVHVAVMADRLRVAATDMHGRLAVHEAPSQHDAPLTLLLTGAAARLVASMDHGASPVYCAVEEGDKVARFQTNGVELRVSLASAQFPDLARVAGRESGTYLDVERAVLAAALGRVVVLGHTAAMQAEAGVLRITHDSDKGFSEDEVPYAEAGGEVNPEHKIFVSAKYLRGALTGMAEYDMVRLGWTPDTQVTVDRCGGGGLLERYMLAPIFYGVKKPG